MTMQREWDLIQDHAIIFILPFQPRGELDTCTKSSATLVLADSV